MAIPTFSTKTKRKLFATLTTPLIIFFLIVAVAVAVVGVQTSNENRSQASEDWTCTDQADPDQTCIRNAGCKAQGGWACKDRKVTAIKPGQGGTGDWCGAAAKTGKTGGVCQGDGNTVCGGDGVETICTNGHWQITGACCTGKGGQGGRPTSCGKNTSANTCTGQCSWITCDDGTGICSFKDDSKENVCKTTKPVATPVGVPISNTPAKTRGYCQQGDNPSNSDKKCTALNVGGKNYCQFYINSYGGCGGCWPTGTENEKTCSTVCAKGQNIYNCNGKPTCGENFAQACGVCKGEGQNLWICDNGKTGCGLKYSQVCSGCSPNQERHWCGNDRLDYLKCSPIGSKDFSPEACGDDTKNVDLCKEGENLYGCDNGKTGCGKQYSDVCGNAGCKPGQDISKCTNGTYVCVDDFSEKDRQTICDKTGTAPVVGPTAPDTGTSTSGDCDKSNLECSGSLLGGSKKCGDLTNTYYCCPKGSLINIKTNACEKQSSSTTGTKVNGLAIPPVKLTPIQKVVEAYKEAVQTIKTALNNLIPQQNILSQPSEIQQ